LIDVSAEPRVPETHLFGTPTTAQRSPAASDQIGNSAGKSQTRDRLGGLLEFYHREAACIS